MGSGLPGTAAGSDDHVDPRAVHEGELAAPPHLLGDQIVSEAQRLVGVRSVALYLVDINGTRLLRLAGSEEFPAELEGPLAIGPELPREGCRSCAS